MDKYTKLFEVGDVIRPTEEQQRIFRGYHYEAPFVVIKSYPDSLGRWLLKFGDLTGRGTHDAGWYQYRFERVFKSYDPKQTGDQDDDI